jgi:hypothetical protein
MSGVGRRDMRVAMRAASGPKKKDQRHLSYDESCDEPARLIQNEPVDIERETPADDTEPVEEVPNNDTNTPAAFDE